MNFKLLHVQYYYIYYSIALKGVSISAWTVECRYPTRTVSLKKATALDFF